MCTPKTGYSQPFLALFVIFFGFFGFYAALPIPINRVILFLWPTG
jgi:hypothetical protein